MAMTNPHAIRVLARPPQPPPPEEPYPPPKNGVVVVGFIGKRHRDVAHLINRVIDSNVFGNSDGAQFRLEADDKISPEMRKWFERRKLGFYHDEEQGILYLQFSSVGGGCPVVEEEEDGFFGCESVFEDSEEFGDLQGLIFMFSVCHIIILIEEGSRFNTQMLKKFRVLQAAKHSMAPFVRSQSTAPAVTSARPRSSAQSRTSPNNPSPGKGRGGILNRNASSITVMSGLGSYTSLFPGQCTPVLLFVFIDDFTEINPNVNLEDPSDTSSNPSSNFNTSKKGSGSVVVLSRPMNKSEGGQRKKLQSSLEAQIRFSIKKCRTLGAVNNSGPLFSLDASKAVSLIDASSVQSGESLEFAIGLVEEVLNGKATPDSLLLESHQQNASKEDVFSVKEFIYRQSDLLRGKGGLGSAGAGMVAAAAAAAAAAASTSSSVSAASGKTVTATELPTVEIWLSSSQVILHGILSAKRASMHEADAVSPTGKNAAVSNSSFESMLSHLENGVGLNTRFSTLWCEKSFPVAKEVYTDGLPPCYPSAQHEDHLKKALHAFDSMVKGPAVQFYMKKLEEECTSMWITGRQLCDAVSLTGKPCMHQRHDDVGTLSSDELKPHSSGFVYLHACACGRSRRLRPDPFDYESANVVHNIFDDCDKLLPALQLPERSIKGPVRPLSWTLIRVGSARYYEPSKGLLQSGFCATQKFLLRWTVFLEKLNEANHSLLNDSEQVYISRKVGVETVVDGDNQASDTTQNGIGTEIRPSADITGNSNKATNVGRGLSNFKMRKPFSEVVAGPAAANSGFPPLFSRKQHIPDSEKGVRLHNKVVGKIGESVYNQESQKVEDSAPIDKAPNNIILNDDNRFPLLGSNVLPLSMMGSEQIKDTNTMNNVTIIYVGFEHECPHGHRFILTTDHLNELGSPYSVPEENAVPLSVENPDKKQDPAKLGKIGVQGRNRRQPNGIIMGGGSGKAKNVEKPKEKEANGFMGSNKSMQSTRHGNGRNERRKSADFVNDYNSTLKPTTAEDGGGAFSFLNRSLPIYMNCPHCRDSTTKNDTSNIKFAGTISQLQRIFVVTPSFPILLAVDPIIQFELSCLPLSIPDREQKLKFSLDCPVILPPDSFLSLRLPFVYGVELEDGSTQSLKPFENQPQLTAYIMKGTSLQVLSDRSNSNLDPALVT